MISSPSKAAKLSGLLLHTEVALSHDRGWSKTSSTFAAVSLELAVEQSQSEASKGSHNLPQFGFLARSIVAAILFVACASIGMAFTNPSWNSWMRVLSGEQCERVVIVGDPCLKPLPFF